MKITLRRGSTVALAGALLAVLASCVSGPYDGSVDVSYGVGYYEPGGHVYGGWPSRYYVAPPRGDHDRDQHIQSAHEGNRPPQPAYRPAPPNHQAPSLPPRRPQH